MHARGRVAIALIGIFLAFLLIGILHTREETRPLRVSLDFFVNPNHIPLVVCRELGFFAEEGLEVEWFVPADPSDPVKLAASRAVDVALTPQINYMIARSEGLPLIAIGALIDHGLGGLLSLRQHGVETIDDLRGKRIGYSLTPLEPILWESMLDCGGVSIDEVDLINVRYATVAALLSGAVDAIGAFRNFETIQVELRNEEPVFFPQEAYCVPETFDIILVVHPDLIAEREPELRAFLEALSEAIARTREDPASAFSRFLDAQPDLDDELNRRAFDATLPLFAAGLGHDAPEIWSELQSYLRSNGLMSAELPLEGLYTTALLPGEED